MSNIYNEILSGLTTTSYPLEDILLKLKVLSYRLKNKDLADFVNSELNGYDTEAPAYRIYEGSLMGTIENLHCRRTKVNLAMFHLKRHGLEDLNKCVFTEKISTLVEYAKLETMHKPIAPELYGILSEPLKNGYMVTNAYVPIANAFVVGILSSIRTKLLDLMLAMENEFDTNELVNLFQNPTQEQQDKANPIINKFIQNNFNSYGESTQNTKIELETDKQQREHH